MKKMINNWPKIKSVLGELRRGERELTAAERRRMIDNLHTRGTARLLKDALGNAAVNGGAGVVCPLNRA